MADGVVMERKPYPTDVTDDQWRLIEPSIPPPNPGGRPRDVDTREVLNAIAYVRRTGCAWRHLPHDVPPWETVYYYFRCWIDDGTWSRIHDPRMQRSNNPHRHDQPDGSSTSTRIK